jgi:hypothetical protein
MPRTRWPALASWYSAWLPVAPSPTTSTSYSGNMLRRYCSDLNRSILQPSPCERHQSFHMLPEACLKSKSRIGLLQNRMLLDVNCLKDTQMTSPQETTMQVIVDYILPTTTGSMLAFIAVILLAHWKRINITIRIRGRKESQKKKSL